MIDGALQGTEVGDNAGPLLIRAGLISNEQLTTAYQARERGGGTLAEYLVAAGALDEERLCAFYRERLLVPRVSLRDLAKVSPQVIARIPGDMAAEFRVIPVEIDRDKNLVLAMADPSDTHAVDEIAFFIGASVFRVVAPPTAIGWALDRYYGVRLPHLPAPPAASLALGSSPQEVPSALPLPATFEMPKAAGAPARAAAPAKAAAAPHTAAPPKPERKKLEAHIVEDVFNEDTPIPQPVPLENTGSVQRIPPMPLDVPSSTPGPASTAVSDAALRDALGALEAAVDRDAVAQALVAYLARLCRRAAFFVVRKGQLAGWIGSGLGVHAEIVRTAALALDTASTFRDIIRTRLPFRGPVTDPASRDLLIDALGWAPADMLAVPIAVRDKVVGILYGDDRLHPLPDEHLTAVSRGAEAALQRAVAARKST